MTVSGDLIYLFVFLFMFKLQLKKNSVCALLLPNSICGKNRVCAILTSLK